MNKILEALDEMKKSTAKNPSEQLNHNTVAVTKNGWWDDSKLC